MRNVEAQALLKACNLNLASCYLKLGAAAQCVNVCNAILAEEPLNCKALFRRGQVSCSYGGIYQPIQSYFYLTMQQLVCVCLVQPVCELRDSEPYT